MATNIKGDSVESNKGNVAEIISKPDAPINFVEKGSLRTATTLGLMWDAGLSDGGSVVLDYRISIAEQG